MEYREARSIKAGAVLAQRYRIVRRLGGGSMGEVFEARHLELPRSFALKVLLQRWASHPEARRRFRREAELGARLMGRHFASVLDYMETPELQFFAMDLLEGEDLRSLLTRFGALGFVRAVEIVRGACQGVRVAHQQGVVHRDLKPANLFLAQVSGQETCKVLDFGVAKIASVADQSSRTPVTLSGTVLGTLEYMAPEQIRGDERLDQRADVYALGVILHEAACGQRPFSASTEPELMYRILQTDAPPLDELLPSCPSRLVRTVQRAMAKDPAKRFRSIDELLEHLAPIGEGDGRCSSLATQPLRSGRENDLVSARCPRLLAIALGAALTAVCLGFTLVHVRARRPEPASTRQVVETIPTTREMGSTATIALEPSFTARPPVAPSVTNPPPQRASRASSPGSNSTLVLDRLNPYTPSR